MSDKMDKSALKEMYDLISKTTIMRLNKMFKQEQPDVIVSSHPFVTKMVSYLKGKDATSAKLVTVITDYDVHTMWIDGHKQIDKIFVATDKMKKDCINYGVDRNKIEVTGIPISDRFNIKYDKKEMLKKLNLDNDKKVFLFFAGGGLGVGKSKKIFEDLVKESNGIQVIAVAGKNKKQKMIFEKLSKGYDNVKVFGYVENVPELMSVSDLVITKPGGITSTE
jgi:processive 1,2-diacylglycerol beta-glucosyltransferase